MLVKDAHPAVRWVLADPIGSHVSGWVVLTLVFWAFGAALWVAAVQAALGGAVTEGALALIRWVVRRRGAARAGTEGGTP